MNNHEVPRPGVREVTDGIFLYTTRVCDREGSGPTFVFEVESARADQRGVSFGLDFSGSTNLTLLPSTSATRKTSAASAAAGDTGDDVQREAKEFGLGQEIGAVAGEKRGGRTVAVGMSKESKNANLIGRESAFPLLRVSTEAFCRTLVARVTVQDPERAGIIKTSCSWELLDPISREKTAAVVRENAASLRKSLLSVVSMDLAGDMGDASLGAERRVEDVAKRCQMRGVMYIDRSFPPNDSSLGDSLASLATWRRPRDFPGAFAPKLPISTAFGGHGKPLPSDVRPCPFALDASLSCAIAALAELPRLVSAALCGRTEACGLPGGSTSSGERCAVGNVGVRHGGCAGVEGGNSNRGKHFPRGGSRSKAKKARQAAVAAAVAARAGVFSARLCVAGVWEEYVTDDFFPCSVTGADGGGGPCLSRAHGPAMWVSMMEKAYALAVGSYAAALGGCGFPEGLAVERTAGIDEVAVTAPRVIARPARILAVFTGAPILQAELGEVKLGGEDGKAQGADQATMGAEEFWDNVVIWIQEEWLVCLSTPTAGEGSTGASKNGFRLGYAYTVLSTADVGGGNRLVRLRGPLSFKDGWRGNWAADSPLWTPEAISSLRREADEGLGSCDRGNTFWVSINEAMAAFVEVGVCMVGSPGGDKHRRKEGWPSVVRRRVSFRRDGGRDRMNFRELEKMVDGNEDGEHSVWSPSAVYALSVHETSRVYISLHQEYTGGKNGGRWESAGVTVLQLVGSRLQAVVSTGSPAQETATVGAVLGPGTYVVVPTCAGCLEGDSIIRRRGEGTEEDAPFASGARAEAEGEGFPHDVVSALMAMFDGLDADCDGVLCREELDSFLRTTEGLELKDDVYAWLVKNFYSRPRPPDADHFGEKQRGGAEGVGDPDDLCLTRRGFVEMYQTMWEAAGRDLEVVKRDLRFAGCGGGHPSSEGKKRLSVVVSMHSDTRGFGFVAQPGNPALLQAALALPVKRWGYTPSYTPSESATQQEREAHPGKEGNRNYYRGEPDDTTLLRKDATGGAATSSTASENKARDTETAGGGFNPAAKIANADETKPRDILTPNIASRDDVAGAGQRRNSTVVLYAWPGPRGAAKAVTFAVKSLIASGGEAVRASLDCAGSVNASPISGSIGLSREVVLHPGQLRVIQHLVPTDDEQPWSWKHAPLRVNTARAIRRADGGS